MCDDLPLQGGRDTCSHQARKVSHDQSRVQMISLTGFPRVEALLQAR
jgi:hypothetical protein